MSESLFLPPDPPASLSRAAPSREWRVPVDIQHRLRDARPRLLRLARRHGIDGSGAEDAVQETMLHAWKALDQLRSHERFDAWLDAICRNICLQHKRADSRDRHWLAPLGEEDDAEETLQAIPDPAAFDPSEDLTRQDLETLLERALGHLPPGAREALHLCYLCETPQREAALRLGVTITALEARLHRARKQLRDVLAGQMREEAQAFGLFLDEDEAVWHKSRIWCHACGQHLLEGRFFRSYSGKNTLTMRCPGCVRDNGACINIGEVDWLEGIKTFLPALKRLWRFGPKLMRYGLESTEPRPCCVICDGPMIFRVQTAEEANLFPAMPSHVLVAYSCLRCGMSDWSDALLAFMDLPVLRRFADAHPRAVMLPSEILEYAGQRAIRFTIANITSASQLMIFATFEQLRVLDIVMT